MIAAANPPSASPGSDFHPSPSSMRQPNYDKTPFVPVPPEFAGSCRTGWDAIAHTLAGAVAGRGAARPVIAIECYPGVFDDKIRERLAAALRPALVIDATSALQPAADVDRLVAPFLDGDDPVFGYLCTRLELEDFLEPGARKAVRQRISRVESGLVLVVGPAASLVADEADVLVYADLPRWEGQLRQRRGEVANLGADNRGLKASLQYKRSFFVDWRVCDRLKQRTMAAWDFLLDTTRPATPRLIPGAAHLAALAAAARRPFRVVPFFDPGPWGGQWMKEVCALDPSAPNYAWCFDCVPEENSLLLGFGSERVEVPAVNLVFRHPRELLGEPVYGRFGPEFPIRFDFLDTIGGGNLSFQVHPTTDYARTRFGLSYTQDESYYMLDAEPGSEVYLGVRDGTRPADLLAALEAAQKGGPPFPDDRFVARFPARRHDHFLIPAGTVHCSGAGAMVLEISATPYIFTFKLWDWQRLGLDGQPRPVHLGHGRNVIRWDRDESYARARLVNRFAAVARGEGWREERTGLHEAQFIETRRHWFSTAVDHDTGGPEAGGVNVLNLVQGEQAVVESRTGAFEPFVVHYAETFIVPAEVGRYTIRPDGPGAGAECATMKAFVRTRA